MGPITRPWLLLVRSARLSMHAAGAIFTVVLVSHMGGTPVHAQSFSTEVRVKAALLYNFAQFVEWPDRVFVSATDPLVFAIVGRDPFDGHLQRLLDGKSVNGHPIKIVAISQADQADLSGVHAHLLFLARSEDRGASRLVQQIRTSPILTVSEIPSFARLGGMIEVFEEDGSVRFEINRMSAEEAGLKLSSRLLALARITPVKAQRQ
jgi:hypothetical protein